MYITKNFKMEEFTFSQIATRINLSNIPDTASKKNIISLAKNLLQPLRDKIKTPIIITSGYRCIKLNELVNGERDSQHLKGIAADIIIPDKDLKEVFEFIVGNFVYDKVILEYGKWIHISFNEHHNRNIPMICKMVNGKKKYTLYRGN